MADNFNMKQFLAENKLGAYSRLKTEGEAAYEYEKGKAAGEKEEKEKLAKEDYAGAEEEKMMDFLAEYEVIYVERNGKCYRKDDEGNMDEVNMYYCRMQNETEEKPTEEALSMDATERMDGLVPQTTLKAVMSGTQVIIRELKQDGFEDDEIFDFIISKIKTLG